VPFLNPSLFGGEKFTNQEKKIIESFENTKIEQLEGCFKV